MATTDPTITLEPIVNAKQYEGQKLTEIIDINGPVSYTTGGFSLTSATVNARVFMGTIQHVQLEIFLINTLGSVRIGVYNATTGLILLFVPNTGAEVANGTDMSAYKARAKVIGY